MSGAAPLEKGDDTAAVVIDGLRKTYGELVAVDEASFAVTEGEIFGILGANGTGKTTTVECVIGLRIPDAGAVRVLGLGPRKDLGSLHALTAAVGLLDRADRWGHQARFWRPAALAPQDYAL